MLIYFFRYCCPHFPEEETGIERLSTTFVEGCCSYSCVFKYRLCPLLAFPYVSVLRDYLCSEDVTVIASHFCEDIPSGETWTQGLTENFHVFFVSVFPFVLSACNLMVMNVWGYCLRTKKGEEQSFEGFGFTIKMIGAMGLKFCHF